MTVTERLELFFAILALGALGFSGVAVALRIVGRGGALATIGIYRTQLAATVAAVCMAGSLYFSEVAKFVPCTLCWYQRIAMYPLAILLTVNSFRRDSIRTYMIVLASLGAAVSIYHWLLERLPALHSGVCSTAVPCEYIWFETFGFVTLPFMALAGFVTVITLLALPDEQ